jgi:hypothetical protein
MWVHGALWLGERAVERMRGAQEVPWSARNRGVRAAVYIFLVIDKVLAWILFSLLPTTKDKKWRGCCR